MERLGTNFRVVAAALDRLTRFACLSAIGMAFASQLLAIFLRYAFGTGAIWLQDLAAWSFAALVLLSLPAVIALDANVRLDLLRDTQNAPIRRGIDILAVLALLVPFFLVLGALAAPAAVEAWRIGEGSRQIGGLPHYWIIRFMLPLSAALAVVQGLARIGGQTPPGSPR